MDFKALAVAPGHVIGLLVVLPGLAGASGLGALAADAPSPAAVVAHYADMAVAKYDDSLITARRLQAAVDALLAAPSAEALSNARVRWRQAPWGSRTLSPLPSVATHSVPSCAPSTSSGETSATSVIWLLARWEPAMR